MDVVALVSRDQVQFTDQGLLSLTHWTLVGAYIVPGERNDTHRCRAPQRRGVVRDGPLRRLLAECGYVMPP